MRIGVSMRIEFRKGSHKQIHIQVFYGDSIDEAHKRATEFVERVENKGWVLVYSEVISIKEV